MVPTVIVSITLPLSRDACAFTKSTDSTCKMITSTGAFGATCNTCKGAKKNSILKTSVYFRVNTLNTKWHHIFSPCTHCMYEHILYCKGKHSPPSHCWNRRSSTMHSLLEWDYLKATTNSNLPKRDSGISWLKNNLVLVTTKFKESQVSEHPFYFTDSVFS